MTHNIPAWLGYSALALALGMFVIVSAFFFGWF